MLLKSYIMENISYEHKIEFYVNEDKYKVIYSYIKL